MELYLKIRQKRQSNISVIAEKTNVTEDYVRKILRGSRNGTVHKDGKGAEIIKLAKELIK